MTRDVDDKIVTDNGDMEKVLATVAQTVLLFFQHYPNTIIEVTGSTIGRTRLYQILISKYIEELTRYVNIYGLSSENDQLEFFSPYKKYSRFFAMSK